MDSKRIIKIVFDLLLVGLVVYVLYSVLKDKSLVEYGMAFLNVAEVIVGLGILIFVHELGHFLAAKACNVRVEAFSIGFGPAIPGCERAIRLLRISEHAADFGPSARRP